jgi:hypothetical protein
MDPFSSPFESGFADADASFDFGDFQAAEADGESTPTAGSWQWETPDQMTSPDPDVVMENGGSRRSHRRETSRS